ncbi:acylphosphatase [Methylomonas sp. MO1]|uniref:acylphosphatase n=1 Tax=unclassified Methylomonas TaxID=2608980 RepID=UPI000377328D|nr:MULTISPECIES: acylphosphatase [unclassified Methylomonas]MDT4289120.1 acylphosphatase [Methylomonas sp. MO1]
MSECLHIIVKGRVQGVYFRAYTQKQAVKLNIKGFVRNLADGSVEIVASGHAEELQKLVAWCHKGPILAKVSEVIANTYDAGEHFEVFEVR